MNRAKLDAPARHDHGPPVGVVDIGSNSVRLVVYEGLTRSPTPLFNEKALCGLGREVQSTGLLAADAVEQALSSLKRYRALCDTMGVKKVIAIATAACRDAKNGPGFIELAERTGRTEIDALSGARHAAPARRNGRRAAWSPACICLTALSATSAAARSNLSMSTAGACGTA